MKYLLVLLSLCSCVNSPKFVVGDCIHFDIRAINNKEEITGIGYGFSNIKILAVNKTVKNDKYHRNVYKDQMVYFIQIVDYRNYEHHKDQVYAISQKALDDIGGVFWQTEGDEPNFNCNRYGNEK